MLRKSLVAALIGSSCGAGVGYWTSPAPAAIAAPAEVAPPDARTGVAPMNPAAPGPPAQASAQAIRPTAALDIGSTDAVRRARELAQLPDVTALVALREAVLRRAEEAGRKDDPATIREIESIDRYLSEARALRLKLDAAAFRKGT